LHAPAQRLWKTKLGPEGLRIAPEPDATERLAFVGVRACELHAIAIQDRVLLEGAYADPHYWARREGAFLVAVNCAEPAGTCFCASMNTGPKAAGGYDLALTEIIGQGKHQFVVEAGSEAGGMLLAELPHRDATPEEVVAGDAVFAGASARMGRRRGTATVAAQFRESALGRSRRALPDLRQLHDGLSDLLLHHRRGGHLTRRHRERAYETLGFLLYDRFLVPPRRQRANFAALALSPVDDPQTVDMVGPVRHLGLRRLWPLHHLVPSRDRHHRGGGCNPRHRHC
jgi:hypothetical protein